MPPVIDCSESWHGFSSYLEKMVSHRNIVILRQRARSAQTLLMWTEGAGQTWTQTVYQPCYIRVLMHVCLSLNFFSYLQASRSTQRTMFQPAKLTVTAVFTKLKEIALMTGGSVSIHTEDEMYKGTCLQVQTP